MPVVKGPVKATAFPAALVVLPGTVVHEAGESLGVDSRWYVTPGVVTMVRVTPLPTVISRILLRRRRHKTEDEV